MLGPRHLGRTDVGGKDGRVSLSNGRQETEKGQMRTTYNIQRHVSVTYLLQWIPTSQSFHYLPK